MPPIILTRSWIPAVLVLAVLVICARQAAAANDVPDCTPKSRDVADGDALPVANGFTTVDHVEKGKPGAWNTVTGWQPTDKWSSVDTGQLKAQAPDRVRLVFTKADHSVCAQEIRLSQGLGASASGANAPPLAQPRSATEGTFEGCRAAGTTWDTEISRQSGGSAYTVIVFMRSGEICYANRLQGPQGDPIYVGIYSEESDRWEPVQFSPCSLQDAAPAIFVGADAVRLSGVQGENWSIVKIAPRSCYNDSVAIKASGTINGGTVINAPAQIAFQYQQYRLYRATIQLGADFTTQHGSDFGLVTNGMGQSVIHNSAATGRGPEYVISLVIYGLPHYLYSFVGGPAYGGRDILHQQGWADRIGLVTGVGLTDPTRRFVLGASLEAMYGLNVLFVGEAFRQSELDGVAIGDMFTGAAGDIPTHDVWHTKFVVGLSLDLRYVQEIFSGRVHP